jgi:hypothetical protein
MYLHLWESLFGKAALATAMTTGAAILARNTGCMNLSKITVTTPAMLMNGDTKRTSAPTDMVLATIAIATTIVTNGVSTAISK